MNKLLSKIEEAKDKKTLETIKNIIVKEQKKFYYKNAANVKEIIDLDTTEALEHKESEFFVETKYHIKNIMIYQNDMPVFNDFYLNMWGMKFPEKPEQEKVRTKKRHKPKRRSNRRKK